MFLKAYRDLANAIEVFAKDKVDAAKKADPDLALRGSHFGAMMHAKQDADQDLGRLSTTEGASDAAIVETVIWRVIMVKVFWATKEGLCDLYQTPAERKAKRMGQDTSLYVNAGKYAEMVYALISSMMVGVDEVDIEAGGEYGTWEPEHNYEPSISTDTVSSRQSTGDCLPGEASSWTISSVIA